MFGIYHRMRFSVPECGVAIRCALGQRLRNKIFAKNI